MNEIINAMIERRSCKSFKSDMLPKETIDEIITAGLWAANGRALQTPVIIAVTDKETRDKLSELNAAVMGANSDPFYNAPVVLIVLAPKEHPNRVYDGSLVMGNLMLAAHSMGVGSCWIHRAKEVMATEEGKAILKAAGLEGEWEGIGNCVIGYPDGPLKEAQKRKDGRVYRVE
ncbi:MAG: nitroreductase [Clostridia bacterium]|nr:nitroreductase [Clostridia bacterium]